MSQFIDWDPGYDAARAIAEVAPGLSMTIDTGDLYEAQAPCGCYVSYSCSHPSVVGVCDTHSDGPHCDRCGAALTHGHELTYGSCFPHIEQDEAELAAFFATVQK